MTEADPTEVKPGQDAAQVWATNWRLDSSLSKSVLYEEPPDPEDFLRRLQMNWTFDPANLPMFLSLNLKKLPAHDYITIQSMLMMVSDRFKDVVSDFTLQDDSGLVAFHQLPLFAADKRTFIRHAWLMHVSVKKRFFVPEQSGSVRHIRDDRWNSSGEKKLVMRRGAHQGADLWMEEQLSSVIFFSDRLTAALLGAGMKPKAHLKFWPCIMVD